MARTRSQSVRALMWFRSDLRVHDNAALTHACQAANNGVIAVFAVCPSQWADHGWGSMKVDFVLRNARSLSESLAKLNIPLLLLRADRFSELPRKLLHLAGRHACDRLFFNEEYEVNERRRDAAVTELFEEHGRSCHSFTDQVIADVGRLRTGSGGYYTVFTPFRRKWIEALKSSNPPSVACRPRPQKSLGIRPDTVPKTLKGFTGNRRPDLWPEGERFAQKRLATFLATDVKRYHQTRDLPAMKGTSALSPYLAAGVLSARQCLRAALEANQGRLDSGGKGVTTWITELAWRDFYRHVLIGFPRICLNRPFRDATNRVSWRYDEKDFRAWCDGRTGVPIVDAGMRQLAQTGWMHNRLRMITAMFLAKDLFIDWRWGERHFMQQLVDGDFASNNGGWQWSASTGTDAAPYFRIFNPWTQGRRCDPDGDYIRAFVSELRDLQGPSIHEPHKGGSTQPRYPEPIVDHSQARRRILAAFKRLRR